VDGKADELFERMKSIRELAESFNKRSGALMQEGRRSLLDISQAAQKVTRKFDPLAGAVAAMPPHRENRTKSGSERGSILAIDRRELSMAFALRSASRFCRSILRCSAFRTSASFCSADLVNCSAGLAGSVRGVDSAALAGSAGFGPSAIGLGVSILGGSVLA